MSRAKGRALDLRLGVSVTAAGKEQGKEGWRADGVVRHPGRRIQEWSRQEEVCVITRVICV